jgi:hypothetical protein
MLGLLAVAALLGAGTRHVMTLTRRVRP